MASIEYVRVRDKELGHEKSIPASSFDPALWARVDKPAVDINGDPLPSKPRTSASTEAAKSKSGRMAATEKENG